MTFRYAGANGGGEQYHHQQQQQPYYDEREKMRGRSLNLPPSQRREREQMRHGHGGSFSVDSRYRNGYGRGGGGGDRHTVDRERFQPRYNEAPFEYDYDEDIEQQRMPRRMMRERETSPPRDRHMRYSEDRQMGGSPRYQRAGRESQMVVTIVNF
jgi:hypothetical protein